ncbi:MAG TPA: ATP-binding protein, partial [Blastocatellia bacterium]|nr:ATP-binding protein [Blastocatellia bacterium]
SEQREYVELTKSSADALLSLVDDILDLSKIEAGKLDLEPIDFSLRESIDGCLKTLAVRARQKGLNLGSEVTAEVPDALTGDCGRLRQLLINLIGNALKFTSHGGVTVRVAVESLGPGSALLHFSVTDTGIGISPENQQVIFEAFCQADVSTARRYGGTGLGLAISSSLVKLMGGQIWVESKPGLGSTFHFTTRFGLQALTRKEEASPAISKPPLEPLHILVAEDNQINQSLAVRLLEKGSHTVVIANDGPGVVAAFGRERFDLILMDVRMPGMSGYEVTHAIREIEKASGEHIPIVALTAHALKGDRERCLEHGMDGYVSKPINSQNLFEVIEESLHLRRPARSAPAEMVLDKLEAMQRVEGDLDLLREIRKLFLEEYPPLLARIEEAIARDDGPALAAAAHTLKGAIVNFGARPAFRAALRLEKIGHSGKLNGAGEALDEFTLEIEHLKLALAEFSDVDAEPPGVS